MTLCKLCFAKCFFEGMSLLIRVRYVILILYFTRSEEYMESKGRKWLGIIISIIVIVGVAYSRYRRYEAKQERNRAQQQQIENAKAVQEATKKIDEDAKNKLSEQLKDAAKKAGNIAKGIEKLKNADMNKEIEDGYNIVKLDGKFLIVKDSDVDQAVELAGVTDAHVIPTNDQDRNQNYNVLVVKKDGEWRVVDETKKGEDVLVLTGETITADTKFRLKDKTLYIE